MSNSKQEFFNFIADNWKSVGNVVTNIFENNLVIMFRGEEKGDVQIYLTIAAGKPGAAFHVHMKCWMPGNRNIHHDHMFAGVFTAAELVKYNVIAKIKDIDESLAVEIHRLNTIRESDDSRYRQLVSKDKYEIWMNYMKKKYSFVAQ